MIIEVLKDILAYLTISIVLFVLYFIIRGKILYEDFRIIMFLFAMPLLFSIDRISQKLRRKFYV